MKEFNEVIKIEVPVDAIASKLRAMFKEDEKHADLVTEGLIGRMLAFDKSGLSRLYNKMNGHVDVINFKVGEVIKPIDFSRYGYWDADSVVKQNSKYGSPATAEIIEINEYSNYPIRIKFDVPSRKGIMNSETDWVSLEQCSKIPVPDKTKCVEEVILNEAI